MFKTRWGVSVF